MVKNWNEIELSNMVLKNSYGLDCMPYQYLFFKIDEEPYHSLKSICLKIYVREGKARLVLNEYKGSPVIEVEGSREVEIPSEFCEMGENILAYKGDLQVEWVRFLEKEKACNSQEREMPEAENHEGRNLLAVNQAAEFLLNAQIPFTETHTAFEGSCYAIYDETNRCYRMPCWLWSDAPVVSAALALAKSPYGKEQKEKLERLAYSIGEVFLKTQIADETEEAFGALVSRYRYYNKKERSFDCLLGLNDTSYSVKWALLPLYEYTGDRRYLTAARQALDWVEKYVYKLDFAPSHYYFEEKRWENRAFVDTGFCPEGFEQYQKVGKDRDYTKTIDFIMSRFLSQFSLHNGYYGQNYFPEKGVDNRLFTRGHAWVLEGLLACMRTLKKDCYVLAARELVENMINLQRPDGSFSYLMGYGEPSAKELDGSGTCEKATAIFAYLFLEYDRLQHDPKVRQAAGKALNWCENNMSLQEGPGFGGIYGESLVSGITGLPYLNVATGYGNAYYIMAKLNFLYTNQKLLDRASPMEYN